MSNALSDKGIMEQLAVTSWSGPFCSKVSVLLELFSMFHKTVTVAVNEPNCHESDLAGQR